jgi:translation initiation factor IF-2
MPHRIGVCGSCRARFQVPGTFTPNRARCRTCGGVVEIGPAQEDSASGPVSAPPTVAPTSFQGLAPASARAAVPASSAASPAPTPAQPRPTLERSKALPASPLTKASEPPRKRSALVPALVAAGAIAVLALGAWEFFGRGKPVPAQAAPPEANPAEGSPGPSSPETERKPGDEASPR